MSGCGLWVTMRDEQSVRLFLADEAMHSELRRRRAESRRGRIRRTLSRVERLVHVR